MDEQPSSTQYSAQHEHSARSDLLGGAGWVAFGLLILAESLRMERFTKMGATAYTMPGFIPGILGAVITALGFALVFRGWRQSKTQVASALNTEALFNQRILIALPLCIAYAAALLGRIPFWLATALFVAAFTYLFAPEEQERMARLRSAVMSAALTAIVVVGVFQYIFLVRLP